jgi:dephospho-CoA kinase
MIVVGLTGSIAMGKSEVAKVFAADGVPVFDSDREVHALYNSLAGAELLRELAPSATQNNVVDRAELSKLILADPAILQEVEKRVHAAIASRRKQFLAQAEAAGHGMVLFDIPLLFEKSYEKEVDVTIVVSSTETEQRKRALARPGMTAEKLDMILKRQMPDHEKRKRAEYVIENNGTLEDLRKAAQAVLAVIRKGHRHDA